MVLVLVIAVVRVLVRHFKTDSNCGAAPTFATEQDKKHTCRRKAGLNDSIGPKNDPHVGSTTNKCLFLFRKWPGFRGVDLLCLLCSIIC